MFLHLTGASEVLSTYYVMPDHSLGHVQSFPYFVILILIFFSPFGFFGPDQLCVRVCVCMYACIYI